MRVPDNRDALSTNTQSIVRADPWSMLDHIRHFSGTLDSKDRYSAVSVKLTQYLCHKFFRRKEKAGADLIIFTASRRFMAIRGGGFPPAKECPFLPCITTVIASLRAVISEERNRHRCGCCALEKTADNIRHEMQSR